MTTQPRSSWPLPLALGAVTALLHLLTAGTPGAAVAGGFSYFRDEFYYLACAARLDFGYVDHPPLVAVMSWLGRTVFGDSLIGIRVLPSLAAGGTTLLVALTTRELMGGVGRNVRFAQTLAALAAILAPVWIGLFGILSMNAYDVLIWTTAVYVLVRILAGNAGKNGWIWFGIVTGVGLQNKISILFLGVGVVVGLLLTRDWKQFRNGRFWLAGGIAFVIFLPHLIWQQFHGWPTLEFMRNATQFKNLPLSPGEFLGAQIVQIHPVTVLMALAGLFGFYFLSRDGRRFRALGWAFLAIVALMITQRAKSYYLAPAYALLFAPGAVMVARLAARPHWGWLRPLSLAVLIVSGLAIAPLAKPMLPVETFIDYAQALGQAPGTGEQKEVGRLSQFYADRLGWRELAVAVATVYEGLPPADKPGACVFGPNYGQAGAVEFFADEVGLSGVPVISAHNSYYLWGPGDCTGEVLIVIGSNRETLERTFDSLEVGTLYTCDDCMPYENNKTIWVGRGMKTPLAEVWPRIKNFS